MEWNRKRINWKEGEHQRNMRHRPIDNTIIINCSISSTWVFLSLRLLRHGHLTTVGNTEGGSLRMHHRPLECSLLIILCCSGLDSS